MILPDFLTHILTHRLLLTPPHTYSLHPLPAKIMTESVCQEGKRTEVPWRPFEQGQPRFPARPSVRQSASPNPTPTQNTTHRAFPPKCEPQAISTSSHQGTKKTAPLLMLSIIEICWVRCVTRMSALTKFRYLYSKLLMQWYINYHH